MEIVDLIIFILPAYVANSVPVILHGKTPIDMGQRFVDQQRLLGRSKTVKGFIAGVLAGTLVGLIIALSPFFSFLTTSDKLIIAFLLSLGAMAGDSIGSFIKRRRGIKSGRESFFTDKLWFLVGSLLFAFPYYNGRINLQIMDVAVLLALTLLLHICFNRLAHAFNLKKVPW
ncbi:CDP-2,3-bis-(O-geranylgeranyl)-sn-glycerol synthase [Candidatus Micrarchaeota archaeon]|nr:CDP-2,3-bis-(O-geranylgeranyl)-sn-glycerol synthase [Candidatus Micrarchaeota archaeon]